MKRLQFRTILTAMFLVALAACGSPASGSTYVGILSAGDAGSPIAKEQQAGYQLKSDALGFSIDTETESTVQDELQKSVRNMVEGTNAEDMRAVAILGATSNEATARTAALVNFFNVPMLIPTASGDNLMPSNNVWAFQLSAPGSAYARHLFGQVLSKNSILDFELDPEVLQSFKVAILYEQNTFGENAAVAAAQSAMREKVELKLNETETTYGMEIAVYGSFPDRNPDSERLNDLAGQVKTHRAQLVYLVTSDPTIAQKLVQAFHAQYAVDETPLPLLMGQSGAFASQAFLQTPEAADVYILRQKWDRSRCPDEITSSYAGQMYGAVYLLNNAIDMAREGLPTSEFSFNRTGAQTDQLTAFREEVRDRLKQTWPDIPCIGKVSFDNTGQNKDLSFELITVKNELELVTTTADFLEALKEQILLTYSEL